MKTFKFKGEEYQVLDHDKCYGFVYLQAFRFDGSFLKIIDLKYHFRDGVTDVDRVSIFKRDFDAIKIGLVAATNKTYQENIDTHIVPQEDDNYESQAV